MAITKFSFPTTIQFGPGASKLAGPHLKEQGLKRPLVVTDKGLAALPLLAEFTASLTVGILIDNDDSPIIGLPARLGLRQLGRVEGAITSTADHDNVSQRMSLPPSITRTVPVA